MFHIVFLSINDMATSVSVNHINSQLIDLIIRLLITFAALSALATLPAPVKAKLLHLFTDALAKPGSHDVSLNGEPVFETINDETAPLSSSSTKQLVDLGTHPHLLSRLEKIRSHIMHSSSTLKIYQAICEELNRKFQVREYPISRNEVAECFTLHWPTFVSFSGHVIEKNSQRNMQPIFLAKIDRRTDAPHEIELNADFLEVFENAAENSDLSIALTVILSTLLFHKLAQHLVKVLFNSRRISAAAYYHIKPCVDDTLLGGLVCVVWESSEDVGKMDKIQGLLLKYQFYDRILPIEQCLPFIRSIDTDDIEPLKYASLADRTEDGLTTHDVIPGLQFDTGTNVSGFEKQDAAVIREWERYEN